MGSLNPAALRLVLGQPLLHSHTGRSQGSEPPAPHQPPAATLHPASLCVQQARFPDATSPGRGRRQSPQPSRGGSLPAGGHGPRALRPLPAPALREGHQRPQRRLLRRGGNLRIPCIFPLTLSSPNLATYKGTFVYTKHQGTKHAHKLPKPTRNCVWVGPWPALSPVLR